MPTFNKFRGDAQGRSQVDLYLAENVQIGDIFALTCNRKDLSYIATAATPGNVYAGLVALIMSTDSPPPEEFREGGTVFAEIYQDPDTGVQYMRVYGPADGTPLTWTTSTAEGGIRLLIEEVTSGDPGQNEKQRITLPGPISSGTFTATFNGQTTAAIAYNATNYTVRDALCDLSNIAGTDEVQRLTSTATGGTFTITFEGQTTAAIAFNASAATIQTALEDLSNIAVGDVVCAGGALNVAFVSITFRAVLGRSNRTQVTVDNTSATGGTVVPTTTTAGVDSDVTVTGSAGGPWDVEFVSTYANQDVPLMTGNGSSLVKPAGSYGVNVTTITDGVDATNEKQQLTPAGPPTGGTFTMTFDGQVTAATAYNASAATVQTNLESLSNIAAGDVAVTGSAGGPWVVEFKQAYKGVDVPLISCNGTLLTGGAKGIVQTVTQGNGGTTLLVRVTPIVTGINVFEMQFRSEQYFDFPKGATAAAMQSLMESVYSDIEPGDILVTKTSSSWDIEFLGQYLYEPFGMPGPYLSENTTPDQVTISVTRDGNPTVTNEVQRVTLQNGPTGGTFTLTFRGETTAGIAWNASAATVQAALEDLATPVPGDFLVTGSAGGPWDIEFKGAFAGQDVNQMTIDYTGLTGSSVYSATIQAAAEGTNEVQQAALSGSPSGGTFTLSFESNTTAAIAYDATANTVQLAVQALATLGVGQVAVSGNAGGPWLITFQGTRKWENVLPVTGDATSLSGAAVDISVIQEAVSRINEVQSVEIITATGGTFTLTYSGQTTAAIPRSASSAVVQAALEALSSILGGNCTVTGSAGGKWFVEFIDALGATDLALMTGSSAGLTGTGTQSLTKIPTILPTGPYHLDEAENWTLNHTPADGEVVVFELSDRPVKYGLNLPAIEPLEIIFESTYEADAGLPDYNVRGYYEYRDKELNFGTAPGANSIKVTIGRGEGNGSSMIRICTNDVQTELDVYLTGPMKKNQPAVLWRGTHASNSVNVYRGSVGVATGSGELATVDQLRMSYIETIDSDAYVVIGPAVTLNTVTKNAGYLQCDCAVITSCTQLDGDADFNGSGAMAQLYNRGGDFNYNSTGTLNGSTVVSGDGRLIFDHDLRPKTVANPIDIYGDDSDVVDSYKVAGTNGFTAGDFVLDYNETTRNPALGRNYRIIRRATA